MHCNAHATEIVSSRLRFNHSDERRKRFRILILVMEQGTYKELKSKNVNFSAWVTDVVHIDDDPNGLFENSRVCLTSV